MTAAGGSDGKQAEEVWLRTAEQAERRAALYERLSEQTQAISVTATSGLATVTVDAAGVITALTLKRCTARPTEPGSRRRARMRSDAKVRV